MKTRKEKLIQVLWAILLIFPVVLAITPFVYMFIMSLTQSKTLNFHLDLSEMSLVNYSRVIKGFDFLVYFKNSVIVTVCACVFNCIVSAMAAYGFAKKKFPGRDTLFSLYLATLMIPGQVVLIPLFIIMRNLGLMNSYLALFLPIVNAFGVFLIKQFMVSVPDELLESASIDGSGEIRTFMTIVVPLIKPVIVSLTVFTFINIWNDFVWPLVIVTDSSMQTLTLALQVLQGNYRTNYGLVMAGATLTFLPPFLLYVAMQKQFVEGIALSGLKA